MTGYYDKCLSKVVHSKVINASYFLVTIFLRDCYFYVTIEFALTFNHDKKVKKKIESRCYNFCSSLRIPNHYG